MSSPARLDPDKTIGLGDYVQINGRYIGRGQTGVVQGWAAQQRVTVKWDIGGKTDALIEALERYFKPGDWVTVRSGYWKGGAGKIGGYADDGTGDLFVVFPDQDGWNYHHRVSWQDIVKLDGPPPPPEPEPVRPPLSRMQALEFD